MIDFYERYKRQDPYEDAKSWAEVPNPYDLSGKTSVADIPKIENELWYKQAEEDPQGILFREGIFHLRKFFSWAIPCEEALQTIKKYGPICEVGAGSGYWASLLADRGVDIEAYDTRVCDPDFIQNTFDAMDACFEDGNDLIFMQELLKRGVDMDQFEDFMNNTPWAVRLYFPVQECSQDFVPPSDRTLFLCWPMANDPMANDLLNRYKGDNFIFIGEWWSGCNGDDRFFKTLKRKWEEVEEVDIPRHWLVNDAMYIFKRRSKWI